MGLRKMYGGAAVATTLNGAIAGGATSIVVTNGSTYPDGSGGPFVIAIDRTLATEEKILVASRSGNTLTVTTRGYDGTAAQAHGNLAVVEHVLDAVTIDEANRAASLLTTKGDLFGRDATNVARLPAGANDTRLVADSTQGIGLRWAPDTELKLVNTKGDLLVATADNVIAALAAGANDRRLVADSTQASGLRYAPDTELKLVDAKGDLLIASAADTLMRLPVANDRALLYADSTVPGGIRWNVGAMPVYAPTISQGGVVTYNGNGFWTRQGRAITVEFIFTITGSGTASTLISFDLPVAADAGWVSDYGCLGQFHSYDAAPSNQHAEGVVTLATTTAVKFRTAAQATVGVVLFGIGVHNGGLAAGDILSGCFTYPAAGD